MSLTPQGNYNATYSFANDPNGGLASGASYVLPAQWDVQQSYLGHQKVLHVDGPLAWAQASFPLGIITDTRVNISYWFCGAAFRSASSEEAPVQVISGSVTGPYMAMYGSDLSYFTTFWNTLMTCSTNRWYHIRLSIRLDTDRYDIYVDGVKLANNVGFAAGNDLMNITGVRFQSWETNIYWDAIDVEHYDAGYGDTRNAIELGQVGIYNATNSFEDETMFTLPGGFINDLPGSSITECVVPGIPTMATSHRNILMVDDQSGSQYGRTNLTFPTTLVSGSIEYWIYDTNVADANGVQQYFYGGASYEISPIRLSIQSSNFQYYTGVWNAIQAVSSNTWYHVRVEWTGTQYSIWINGLLKLVAQNYIVPGSNIGRTFFGSTGMAFTGTFYLDAVDISSDPEYVSERNSYMQLEQENTFSELGSYAVRYTLTSSGTDYAGSWTPFSVVVPEVPPVPEYTVLFSASSGDLLGVPVDAAFLSMDGVSQAWGPVDLLNGTHNITVRDYFGDVLFSQNLTFVAGGSYNIPLTLATLVINNYQGEPISVELTKTGCSGTFRQLVGAQDSIVIRLASATYRVRAYNLRGDLVGEQASVVLAPGANQQADFGTPAGPFTLEWMILAGILALCAILLVVANARIGGKGERDEYRFLEGPTKEDKRAKMAAYVAPEAPPKVAAPEAKTPAPAIPAVTPLAPVKPKPEVKPASAAEKLSPIDPRREFIKQIDKDIDFLYAFVRTLDAQFGQGQITNDLYLQQKNAAAEKIGELMGKKEQFLSEKPKA